MRKLKLGLLSLPAAAILSGCMSSEAPVETLVVEASTEVVIPHDDHGNGGNAGTNNEETGPTAPVPCNLPVQARQGGAVLTQAMIDAWPAQFAGDASIMQYALQGNPHAIAWVEGCLGATIP